MVPDDRRGTGVSSQLADSRARVLHHRLFGVQVVGDRDNREKYHQRAAESHESTESPFGSRSRALPARPPETAASRRQQQPTEVENQFH